MVASKQEKILIVMKYAGVAVTAATGLLQPVVYSRLLTQEEFAFLLTFSGMIATLLLFEAGVGKAFYIQIRERFIGKHDCNQLVSVATVFYGCVFLIGVIIFLVGATIYSRKMGVEAGEWIYVYAIGTFLLSFYGLYRPVLNALDFVLYSEAWEVYRKFCALIFLGLLVCIGLIPSVGIYAVFSVLILFPFYNLVSRTSFQSLVTFRATTSAKRLQLNVRRSCIFTVSELITYNSGFILVPLFLGAGEVVIYGVAMRIYLSLVMLTRVIADTYVHRFSRLYISGEYEEARGLLKTVVLFSILLSVLLVSILYMVSPWLLPFLIKDVQITSTTLAYICGVVVSNSFLHVFGCFFSTLGDGLKVLQRSSMYFAPIFITAVVVGINCGSAEAVLMMFFVVYLLFSLLTVVLLMMRFFRRENEV